MGKHTRILSAVLAALMLFTGCSATGSTVIAEASYPEMSPYPNEQDFFGTFEDGAIFDSDGFSKVYDAWWEDQQKQRNQPEGYADGLDTFFRKSIPAFLSSGSENPVCSPLNLYMSLAMLAETAGGNSRQQILDVLGSSALEALRTQASQVWNAHYCNDGATTSILANSLWLEEGPTYNSETVNTLANSYYASVYQGDLGSEEMNKALRSWLSEQTGGLLEEQAQNVELTPQTVLALASTVLYRAKWYSEFSEEKNTEGIFHAPSGDTNVTFMHKQLSYGPYFWGTDFGAVYLTLEDGSRMWLILPDEGKNPADILESGFAMELALSSSEEYENQKRIKVNLSLPKFDITADTRMEEAFQQLGITEVFDPKIADFSAILPDQAAWLDKVQHAARVTIDEEGVSAAAYTMMAYAGAAMPPEDEVDFILDRPFLFVITSRDCLPLFAGVVNNP